MKILEIKSSKRNYKVVIDSLLSNVLDQISLKTTNFVLFVDSKIDSKLVELVKNKFSVSFIYTLEGGEETKTLEQYEKIISYLTENDISKSYTLIAMGGGTISDLIGYVAATYKRGIPYITIPTTTLAMIDASIGGKTAINVGKIKNCIGVIYPPESVLIGLDTLESLNLRNFKNGLYEALKMGAISDKRIFDIFLEKLEMKKLEEVITLSIEAKKKIVEEDEFEDSIRRYLNFGHTLGHALELSNNLLHGEAIANGMLLVSKNASFYQELRKILANLGLNEIIIQNKDSIVELVKNDKKIENDILNLVVCDELNKPFIKKLTIDEFKEMI